jgi:hypothetical protein
MMAVLRRRAAVHKRSVIHFDPGTDAEWMTCWVEHDDQPVVSVRLVIRRRRAKLVQQGQGPRPAFWLPQPLTARARPRAH